MRRVNSPSDILVCPACGGRLKELSVDLKCLSCGMLSPLKDGIYLMYNIESAPEDIRLSAQSWNKIYEAMSMKEVEEYYTFYTENLYPEIRSHIARYAPLARKGIFLEIGSGLSVMGIHFATMGYQVVCIDLCVGVLKKARDLYDSKGVDAIFICGNILEMPIRDGVVDLSFGRGVIEHFEDTRQAVSELYRVAAPGGKVMNTVPPISLSTLLYRLPEGNIPNLFLVRQFFEWFFIRLLKERCSVHGYELSFTVSQMRRLFLSRGFESVDAGWPGFFVPINRLQNEALKRLVRKLFRYRPFWHSMYINASRPKGNKP